tara:strand:- start:20562 stop:21650 length:1089 start_codon:yes stop_codon:yes gene_type:complete
MNLTIVAGARPNFMKIAPIIHEINRIKKHNSFINYRLIHTGQHYDQNMSDSFFKQLNIPSPHINLNCGSGSQAEITSSIMISFEKELIKNKPDLVLVVGDVTSTMACAITSQKLKIKVAHVEGGIRSGDWSMPEEINRLVTDSITNYFFTTSEYANNNLINEGVDKKNIYFVGNTMIDTLIANKSKFKKPSIWKSLDLKKKSYIIITLHRPANVDEKIKLEKLLNEILNNSNGLEIIFPMHPRTKVVFDKLNIFNSKLHVIEPLSYLEFNFLVLNSFAVITDSGGITEESTVMNIPCITLRDNTERPETVIEGTNELIGTDPKNIKPTFHKLLSGKWKQGKIPKFWDGKTSKRIVKHMLTFK